jgi:hypothetical protein
MLNEDYKEILLILTGLEVKYLIVGAYAMAAHGYPRATGDIDIWVETSKVNSQKLFKALEEFGAPLFDITPEAFEQEGIIFQIGVAPRRIDFITAIDGVGFADAYADREIIEVEDLRLPFISKEKLILNKRSTGREKDRLDAEFLTQ